ncbi:hypothetical protein LIER_00422 [Lithospermum erythrorhizon]|uniref:F-box protein n=1 Tax=Lithospermum erythrorhizon TaxID=34254 RepID=A0AAV3NIE6_LITER
MGALKTSLVFSFSTSTPRISITKVSISQTPHLPTKRIQFQVSSLNSNDLIDEFKTQSSNLCDSTKMIKPLAKDDIKNQNVVEEMYAILEAVADRVEMHKNIGEQRNNWNQLLLSSVNGMITTGATMAGIGAISGDGAPLLALKSSSTLLYLAATGILMIMNKIQPSQLAEEQRNASRLFKQLQVEIQTTIALKKVNCKDVEIAMENVLALDKAYPLPLLGAMLDKFPKMVEPAVWWPKHVHDLKNQSSNSINSSAKNGWNEMLEDEMRKVMGLIKRNDEEDYIKLAKIALLINNILGRSGPFLTGLAAIGSAFMGPTNSWGVILAIVCGSLGTIVNTIEHGGQVGMVFEMYRSSAGFFRLMEENIETALEEGDGRENGEVFEAKVALQLGRSLSELRELARASRNNPNSKEEFASKLF